MKKFDFKEQMKAGDKGEADFKKYYAELKPVKSEDLKYDFLLEDGNKIEVKCDTYPLDKTLNFFMEQYSDANKQSLGGPWRAANHNIDYFVYYFIKNKAFYWFDPKELVSFLDAYIESQVLTPKFIANRGWVTSGFPIPRDAIEHLLKRKNTF